MPRWFFPLLLFAVTGLALSVSALVYLASHRQPQAAPLTKVLRPDAVTSGLLVPAFSLTDQDGKPQNQSLLEGHVTVIDFIFTHCPFACPTMTAAMIELQDKLSGTHVRFASFSVDPGRDTPDRLKAFAAEHGADTTRWSFLTGDYSTVEHIARDALGFLLQPDTGNKIDLPDGGTMTNIMHPTKLILIGPDRGVLGFYDPNRGEDMKDLALRARLAAQELSNSAPR